MRRMGESMKRAALFILAIAAVAAPAGAQERLRVDITGGIAAPMPIAIPPMPTPNPASTAAGNTAELGRQVAAIVTNDLKNSGLFSPLPPGSLRPVSYPEVTADRKSTRLNSSHSCASR